MAITAVKIMEVGPRDGLQNEKGLLATVDKLAFIQRLVDAGLRYIEATSFVHPRAIPQLADALDVVHGLPVAPDVHFSALVPNMKGLERALEAGLKEIAVFTATSDTFNKRNINMSVDESLQEIEPVVTRALQQGLFVRGYISTAFYCPYEGKMSEDSLLMLTQRLLVFGIQEISIGDTIGQATPADVTSTLKRILPEVPLAKIAMHFHDTNGLALENVQASLDLGITTFDSSAGGLGGCPYAPGASGNLSTDELVAYLHARNIETGIHPEKLALASQELRQLFAKTDAIVEDIGNLRVFPQR
jgi:hydroxymethylglutaryl-CoA lyase